MEYVFTGCLLARGFKEKMDALLRLNAQEVEDIEIRDKKVWLAHLRRLDEEEAPRLPLYIVKDNEDDNGIVGDEDKHCRVSDCESKKGYRMIIPLEMNSLTEAVYDHPEGNSRLHVLVHDNSFSHLLWIQRTSSELSGHVIMRTWDKLCQYLEISGVTVEDTSRKMDTPLPVFYGLVYGFPWFDKWGYKYWKGTYGVNRMKFEIALSILRSLDPNEVIQELRGLEGESLRVQNLIMLFQQYSYLSHCEFKSLGSLLQFVMYYPTHLKRLNEAQSINQVTCKNWTRTEVTRAVKSVVEVLTGAEVLKEDPKGAAITETKLIQMAGCKVGEGKLLDHVIELLSNYLKVGPSQIVVCRQNPSSGVKEFSIEKELTGRDILGDCRSDAAEFCNNMILDYPEEGVQYQSVHMSLDTVLNYKYLLKGSYGKMGHGLGKEVNCRCGANEDDGESMVKCSNCDVYEHSKCSGMDNHVHVHTCGSCIQEQIEQKQLAGTKRKIDAELDAIGDDALKEF